MATYRRLCISGGTYAFTVAAYRRNEDTFINHAEMLKAVIRQEQQRAPFYVLGCVLLPDHMHAIWRLPSHDSDYSSRWRRIKANFSRRLISTSVPKRASNRLKNERDIWQRRFWEHNIRDEGDLNHCLDYLHYNPVKHGYTKHTSDWAHSTFHAWCARGRYPKDWAGPSGESNP